FQQSSLRLRPDPRNRGQPSRARGLPELVRGRDTERAADLDHPLRADAEKPGETDELGLHLALQVVELGDAAGLDELTQATGNAWADPAQFLDATRCHELGDRRPRLANRLRGPPIGAQRVVAGPR